MARVVVRDLPDVHDALPLGMRRELALAQLGPLTTPLRAAPYRRVLVASRLADCDCYCGVVVRTCLERHFAMHRDNRAQLWEPKELDAWSRLHDFLMPLPGGCELAQDQPRPARNEDVVLPAMRIDDVEIAALLGHTVVRVGVALGLGVSAARAVAQALVTFTDNARRHAADSPIGVLAACAVESRTDELHLVVLDLGTALVSADRPSGGLRNALARSRAGLGGMASLMALVERRGIDATLRIASSDARARWRSGGRVRYDQGEKVPGFVASFSVRL